MPPTLLTVKFCAICEAMLRLPVRAAMVPLLAILFATMLMLLACMTAIIDAEEALTMEFPAVKFKLPEFAMVPALTILLMALRLRLASVEVITPLALLYILVALIEAAFTDELVE